MAIWKPNKDRGQFQQQQLGVAVPEEAEEEGQQVETVKRVEAEDAAGPAAFWTSPTVPSNNHWSRRQNGMNLEEGIIGFGFDWNWDNR
jgi:hypothetical protein